MLGLQRLKLQQQQQQQSAPAIPGRQPTPMEVANLISMAPTATEHQQRIFEAMQLMNRAETLHQQGQQQSAAAAMAAAAAAGGYPTPASAAAPPDRGHYSTRSADPVPMQRLSLASPSEPSHPCTSLLAPTQHPLTQSLLHLTSFSRSASVLICCWPALCRLHNAS